LALVAIPLGKAERDALALAVAVHCALVAWLGWSEAPTLAPALALFVATGAAAVVARNSDQPWGLAGAAALFGLSVARLFIVLAPGYGALALAFCALLFAAVASGPERLR